MIKIFLAALFFATQVFAADTVLNTNKTKIGQKSSSANKILEFDINAGAANPKLQVNPSTSKIQFTNDGTVFKDIGSGSGGGSGINLLTNGGFETGLADGWINSGGTWAIVTTGTNLLYQLQSAAFTATAAAQFFETSAIAVPEILKGRDCLAKITYKGSDANLYLTVMDSVSAELIPTTARAALNSTTGIKDAKLYFTCPSSGSVKMRIQSTAASVIGAFDDATLGAADFQPTKQSQYLGSVKYIGAASCSWSTTATSFTNFGLTAACNTAVATGVLQPPATKIPALIIPYAAKGTYFFSSTGKYQKGLGSDGSAYFRFSDGTNFSNSNGVRNNTSFTGVGTISGQITLTSDQTNWPVQIQGATDGTAQAFIEATGGSPLTDFEISVYYYPSGTDTVVNSKCPNDIACENTFSAKVSNTGVVSDENLDWINGNCTNGSTGAYTCNFNSGVFNQNPNCNLTPTQALSNSQFLLNAGVSSSLININTYSSAALANQSFLLTCQKSTDFKARQNIQGFLSSTVASTASNVRIETAYVSSVCSASPCTITNQTGAINTITRVGAGSYSVNFLAGTFTTVPSCSAFASSAIGNPDYPVSQSPFTSLTAFPFGMKRSDTHVLEDAAFSITCIGQR